jgi:hypothetical protein
MGSAANFNVAWVKGLDMAVDSLTRNTGQSYDWMGYKATGTLVSTNGSTGRHTNTVNPRLMSFAVRSSSDREMNLGKLLLGAMSATIPLATTWRE